LIVDYFQGPVKDVESRLVGETINVGHKVPPPGDS
jgi:hypothetical protein